MLKATFAQGTEADCFNRYEQSYAEREWFVVPLWHPQYLHHAYKIRALDEPLGLLGGEDQATLIAASDVVQKMPKELIEDLVSLQPGNAAVSELDFLIRHKSFQPWTLQTFGSYVSQHRRKLESIAGPGAPPLPD